MTIGTILTLTVLRSVDEMLDSDWNAFDASE